MCSAAASAVCRTGANVDMLSRYYHHVLTVCASQTLSKYYLVMFDDSHLSHMVKPSVIARLSSDTRLGNILGRLA